MEQGINPKPLVTVITPSYNHGFYIEKAIRSVKDQTYPNIEHIIIDDGSSDDSHEILQALSQEFPELVIRLYKENKGHIRINEGVALARGKYVSLLSSDDWYLPNKIEKQVQLFENLPEKYGVVYSGGYRYFEDTNQLIEPKTNHKMRRGFILEELLSEPFFIYPISPLIKRECLLKYPFLPHLRAEGEAIYFRIAMKYWFDFIEEPLVVMRDHSANTGKDIYKMFHDNIHVREYLFSHSDFPKDLVHLKNKIIAKINFLKGWELIRIKKDYDLGKKLLNQAIKLYPALLFNPRFIIGRILCLRNAGSIQIKDM